MWKTDEDYFHENYFDDYTYTTYVNNVGRTLLLGLARKQNGRPIGYILLLTLISWPKGRLSHIRRLIYGLIPMAKLVEPLVCVRNTGKLPNRKVLKSQIVLVLVLVLIVDLDKKLCSYNSGVTVGFTLKTTPMNCAYS